MLVFAEQGVMCGTQGAANVGYLVWKMISFVL